MSEGSTPQGSPSSYYLVTELTRQVAILHDRVSKITIQLVEAFGSDGRGGTVTRLAEDEKACAIRVEKMRSKLEALEREAALLRTKLGLVVTGASLAAGATVSILTKLFFT